MSGVSTRVLVGTAVAVVAAAAALAVWVVAGNGPATAPGEPVPAASFEMFDGSTATMADYAGRPVVVNFWASWCPPCIAEMPDLEVVHQEFAGEVAFLGINTQDSPEAAAELVERTGVTYDLARDPEGQLFQAFEVFGMPTTLFVSAEGRIVDRHTGILTLEQARAFVTDGLSG